MKDFRTELITGILAIGELRIKKQDTMNNGSGGQWGDGSWGNSGWGSSDLGSNISQNNMWGNNSGNSSVGMWGTSGNMSNNNPVQTLLDLFIKPREKKQ
ncbi:hypothetical protein CHS0354_040942 [Potamilus streckersoni]|uniref:Uncharacterized protein n=1 Tax=Potamilus streckersoni TaxID=2493646 RepID=A0AAE0W8U0_9BIVA|nr:hypothetical protein CHS0354_040942 [Potamilus streckersoni]